MKHTMSSDNGSCRGYMGTANIDIKEINGDVVGSDEYWFATTKYRPVTDPDYMQ